MIKKLIFLAVLAGLGYVGYLVWNNLTESEKAEFKEEAGKVVDKGTEVVKDTAKKAADWTTEKIREDKDEPEKEKDVEKDPEKKSPPVPKGPGKIVIPSQ